MKFTLRQLEIFVAVAHAGSVSRAAEQLSLSQSAASTALGELERSYDQTLFDRVGKKLVLNDTGQWMLPRALEILDRASELERQLGTDESIGNLRLGASLTIGNYLATLLVADFLQQHPSSRVQLVVQNSATIIEQVARYELDLGLIEGDMSHPDVVVSPWLKDELVVFAAPDHPLAKKKKVELQQVLKENWILREAGSGTRSTFERALGAHHTQLNVRLELEHTEAIKRAVEAGLGLGCISRLALRDAFRRGSLAPIALPELQLQRQFYMVHQKNKYLTSGIRSLMAHIREGVAAADTAEVELPLIP
ncbi:MAG TPA: LysR family transcriptional regulator [Rhodocyclaceae bacterium]|jgi:DNA-binding transcriptional LysR family regulator|nr:LysR family transcriptional regulator [Rhodocyclaceae bacterium]